MQEHRNVETVQFQVNPTLEKCKTTKTSSFNGENLLCLFNLNVNVITNNGVEEVRDSEVELLSKPGYIFIQTDRPVYKPREKGF